MHNVHIHIEGYCVSEILDELRTLLAASTFAQPDKVLAAAAAEIDEKPTVAHEQNAVSAGPEAANDVLMNATPEPTKRRGRPKKSDAPTPVATSDTAAPVPPPSEPAEPVAQESSAVAPLLPSGDPAPLSFQQFKDEMLAITNLNPNVNLGHCTKAINDHGFARVKDLKDAAPEIYASVIKKAKELVAAA